MSLRLLPFRQYDEQDVINLFALQTDQALAATTDNGLGSNGVFVSVSTGNFNSDVVSYGTDSYLGKEDYSHVGAGMYPSNPRTVQAAGSGAAPLGLTLNQTAKNDENGEKLLYNPTKKEELQAVLPGQTVPVLTRGIVTLSASAFDVAGTMSDATFAAAFPVGGGIRTSDVAAGATNAGTVTGVSLDLGADVERRDDIFGKIIGTGSRAGQAGITDQFEGRYIVVQFSC